MSYLLLFFLFFVALFLVYALSKNDLVLLRKQIDPTKIFNLLFVCLGVSGIAGRVFYIIDANAANLLNPLRFIHFLKFSGFSLFGAMIGFSISLFFFTKERDALKRIYDILTISFLPLIVFGFVLRIYAFVPFAVIAFLTVVMGIVFIAFARMHKNYVVRDGSLFFIMYSIFSFSEILLGLVGKKSFHLSFTQIVSIIVFCLLLVLLARNESLFSYMKKREGK